MSCHFKCEDNNNVYIVYSVLHRTILKQEFIGRHLFCSKECQQRFEEEFTIIENDYVYYKEITNPPRGYCHSMREEVKEFKEKNGIAALIKSLRKSVKVE